MLVTLTNVSRSFGEKTVIQNADITIGKRSRIGIIGVNGVGKTTLLRLISGDLTIDSGERVCPDSVMIGYQQQDSGLNLDGTIGSELLSVFAGLTRLESRLNELEALMQDGDPAVIREYAQLSTQFEASGGHDYPHRIAKVKNGMGFHAMPDDTAVSTLSGGEKTRLSLAKLLLAEPNLLILDEPTNHLDFKTISWLEDFLKAYPGALLAVSHDRYFLDAVADTIYEIEHGATYRYVGNFTRYLTLREVANEQRQKDYDAYLERKASLEDYVARNLARASTSAMAKSRRKQLEKLVEPPKPFSAIRKARFHFLATGRPAKETLTIRDLTLTVGEGIVLTPPISFEVRRGDRVAVVGDNGIGKTTLLKTLVDASERSSALRWGQGAVVGYFDQEHRELDPHMSVFDTYREHFPTLTNFEVRSALAQVLLSGENVFKPVGVISGGEKARLCLALLMGMPSNVLVLDEPSNHLDLAAKAALEEALAVYDGTLIFVSHDRYLINTLATRVVELNKDGAIIVAGNFDDYAAYRWQNPPESGETRPAASGSPARTGEPSPKEKRRAEAEKRQQLSEIEGRIAQCETRAAEIRAALDDPEVFSDYQKLSALTAELDALSAELAQGYDAWAKLAE